MAFLIILVFSFIKCDRVTFGRYNSTITLDCAMQENTKLYIENIY